MLTFRPVVILLTLLAVVMPARQTVALDSLAVEGCWQGYWETPRGYYYEARAKLTTAGDDNIGGTFIWTLQRSPLPADAGRIGLQGTEFVSGRFEPAGNLLSLDGTAKDDPDTVIGLDKYRLVVAENGKYLAGVTASNDTWDGLFRLEKIECQGTAPQPGPP